MSGRRLHPLSAVTRALYRGVVGLSVPVFLAGVLSGIFDPVDVGWAASGAVTLAPVGFVLGSAYGLAYYYRFEYELTDDTFDVASGVLSRRDREIPFRRIQNVDVRQGVVHRLLGLAVVSIETAGGGDTEAALQFVSRSEATRLRREIRRRTAEAASPDEVRGTETDPGAATDHASEPSGEPASDPRAESNAVLEAGEPEPDALEREPRSGATANRPTLLFGLESRELLLYAFTTFRPAAAAGLLFLAFLFTDPILEYLLAAARPVGGPSALGTGSPGGYAAFTLVSFLNAVGATYLLSVAYSFGAYYGFRLGRTGEDFVYERGLLQRYSGTIPLDKVQTLTIKESVPFRWFGYGSLAVETAGYAPGQSDSRGAESAVPIAAQDRVLSLARSLEPFGETDLETPPPRARERYAVRYVAVLCLVMGVGYALATYTAVVQDWHAFAVLLFAVPLAAHLKWRNRGYRAGEQYLLTRTGFWRRTTKVVPYYRVQSVIHHQTVFQRRRQLASVTADTASSASFFGRAATAHDIDEDAGLELQRTVETRLQERLQERKRRRTVGRWFEDEHGAGGDRGDAGPSDRSPDGAA